MNLKRYNKETLPSRIAVGVPTLRINKNGNIVFNKPLAEKLELTETSKIELVQDQYKPKEWYIAVNDSEASLSIKVNKSQAGFAIQNTALAQLFIAAIDNEQKFIQMNVAPVAVVIQDEQLWPIITASYKQYTKNK